MINEHSSRSIDRGENVATRTEDVSLLVAENEIYLLVERRYTRSCHSRPRQPLDNMRRP